MKNDVKITTVVRDIAARVTTDRKNLLAIACFIVRDKILISPILTKVSDQRKFINLEFLIFWRMRIIKSPLLERNVSADKI